MSHTQSATVDCKVNVTAIQNKINEYDFKLNSLMREYRKKETLAKFIIENKKETRNMLAAKINFIRDEIKMRKEEALDVRPKKKVTLSFVSLA